MNEIKELEKIMEEMAKAPREGLGKRQPGERGSYEKYTKNTTYEPIPWLGEH